MGRLLCRLFGHVWQVRTVRNKRLIVWQCARCCKRSGLHFRDSETIPFTTPSRWYD